MIDIVFLLLIFFLTTSQMAEMAAAPLDLPEEAGSTEEVSRSAGLVVNVDAAGVISILEQVIEPEDLVRRSKEVLAQDPSAVPVIRADRHATAARLNAVMDGLRSGGFPAVRMATSSGREGTP